MSVLVTGGVGYVGSHAVKLLVESGEDVICLDNLLFGHPQASCGSKLIVGDIADQDLLKRIFVDNKIDSVLHFAGLRDVGESVVHPQKYYINNISKSLALIETMLDFGIKKIIFSSSAATFGEPEVVPISEDHPQNPTNPYGRTKLMLEEILEEYDTAYGLKSISLRYFNAAGADPSGIIGEDHNPEQHLIPIILQVALGLRDQVSIFGTDWPTHDGTCVRDYVHVSDLAQAHLLALEALRAGHPSAVYNMGNGNGYSVQEVVECARKVTGCEIKASTTLRRPGDPAVLVASSERIIRELGWNPQYPDLKTIVETAWNWHVNHPNGYEN